MVGGLWSAWLFWFFEALVCVSGKTKCAKCVGKKFPFLCVGYFLFFSVSDCCLVRCRSVGSGSRPVIATNACICAIIRNISQITKPVYQYFSVIHFVLLLVQSTKTNNCVQMLHKRLHTVITVQTGGLLFFQSFSSFS